MSAPFGWFLPIVAAGATALAVWAGPNLAVAGPAAALAVLAAGLLFATVGVDRLRRRAPLPGPPASRDVFRVRFAFRSGRLGREEIVTTLDRVERLGPTPDLPARSKKEIDEIVDLPAPQFREYVRARLSDLEVRT